VYERAPGRPGRWSGHAGTVTLRYRDTPVEDDTAEDGPTPTQRFAALVADGEPVLDDALLLIASHAYPDLDVARWKAHLDVLAEAAPAPGALGADELARYCASALRLRGNEEDYGDPRNSYLNEVLTRGLGIPITLSVVMMELGRRLGIELVGVGMPGHFLVGRPNRHDRYWDPFHGFRPLDERGCREVFERVVGADVAFTRAHLAPVGRLAIVARVLMNLQRTALVRDRATAVWVVRLQLTLPGLASAERYELAALLGSLGAFGESAGQLDRVARDARDDSLADRAAGTATALRARTN